ncbi:type IV pilus biogenesis protein PilI [Klebsiella sp. PL-2018]|uniref:type IV pilus biogenesis protein PilI n=1 Tax=Klebsiella TaxID=570 RepID=UPI001C22448E|nr:PilI type IV pilus biogenesis protein [Klebsiella sp. PL-2018]QXD00962.1 hypothetical protein MKleb_5461 [Klebsiella sp. PL-2018]
MQPSSAVESLTVLVMTNACEKQVHTLSGDDPEQAGRPFCQPQNWLVCVSRGNTPLVQFERLPGYPVIWRRVVPAVQAPRRPRIHH